MLALYRRHRQNCKGNHKHNSRSSEYDERKKGWSRCECPIFASGTLDKVAKRQNTGQWEWERARLITAKWETFGRWDSPASESAQPASIPNTPKRTVIVEATKAYLSRCENRGLAKPTLNKYRTFVKQVLAFCEAHGYIMLDQLTVADMDLFYASWKDGKRARAKKLERLKSFINFCLTREWIARDIARDLRAPEGSSTPANKTPFTDDELKKIYEACDAIGGPTPPGPGHRSWGGEDAKDFVYLSVYTGLRISDVATFNIAERLKGNDVFLRMHKTRKELYTWIPDWLVHRLHDRQKKHGPLIFRAGTALNMRAISERWRENLAKFSSWQDHSANLRILTGSGIPLCGSCWRRAFPSPMWRS
jgi:integrase